MTSALIALTLLLGPTFDKVPTDDVWVYPHAADQKDAYLRVWGASDKAVAGKDDSIEEFSYSYLRFDLADLPAGGTLKEAKLILTAVADPGWTAADLKATPLEARLAKGSFTEKDWSYDSMAAKLAPLEAKESIFGVSTGEVVKGKEPVLVLDLLKGPAKFADALKAAMPSKSIALALTSAINPAEVGRAGIYKFYSKDAQEKFRPVLKLAFE